MTQNIPTGANPVVLPPFSAWLASNIPAVYDNTMSYYDELTSLIKYLETVILPALNEDSEGVTKLSNLYKELKSYVENYFKNLDVQEEINNKLDEMAESGELEALISDFIIGGKGQVKYYFPNNTASTTQYTIIQAYGENIMCDIGSHTEYTNLKTNLTKLGITHLDKVIISHYHQDHAAAFNDLVEDNYIDSDTSLYLPSYNQSVWASDSSFAIYQAIMTTIQNEGFSYITPTEGYTITLNEAFNIKLNNTNDTYYYDNNLSTKYNNASLFTTISHFGVKTLLTADAYPEALLHMSQTNVIPKTIHLYQTPHHGIMDVNVTDYDIMRNYTIINSVQIVGMNDLQTGKCSGQGIITNEKNIAADTFVTAYNPDMLAFSSYINSMNLVYGFKSGCDNLNETNQDLYVSTLATSTQNGSQSYPFKSLSQCLGYCERNKGVNYTIHLANGEYTLWQNQKQFKASINNTNNKIEIIGEDKDLTILYGGIAIKNACNVSLKNLNLINTIETRLVDIENSKVAIDNCNLSNVSGQRDISAKDSSVIISNCSFSGGGYGVYEDNSDVSLIDNSFENINLHALYGNGGTFKRIVGLNITDSSLSYAHGTIYPNFEEGFVIFQGSANYASENHEFTTIAKGGIFKYLDVYYTLRGSKRHRRVDIDTSTLKATIGIGDNFISDTYTSVTDYFTTVYFHDSYTASINLSRKFEITAAGATTFTDNDASVTITKVVGF